jgi:GntR family transcriptional repressor for pyruvate dehydrogenase complex
LEEQRTQSAKQRFISIVEQKILSGEWTVDQKLPPERELSESTGISRVTVHAAIIELTTKNVLRVVPRQGTYVNNFKKEGTLELYSALLGYTGDVDEDLLSSLVDFREMIETAGAEMAAVHRTPGEVTQMWRLLEQERMAKNAEEAAELDFQMHLLVAKASGNIVLPMTLHSIEAMYMSLVRRFYQSLEDRNIVYAFHGRLIDAIHEGDGPSARIIMKAMLDHGKQTLMGRL